MATKVTLSRADFQALRSDPKLVAALEEQAERIRSAAGPGFATDSHPGGRRARVTVFPDSFEGILAEARHGALSRAVGSG